ncbi:MAG: PDZ domain-containing protein [Planctomycetes bacterium]|jgi:serine protease Do|nr:PDZ domain-containing protein [Planctomycetota bacterium]MCL4730546.1 PDZ domain-containing protein [Planctomycetota bacterium]
MKKLAYATALLLAIGTTAAVHTAQPKTTDAAPVTYVTAPAMPLHKDLERHRVAVAARMASYTVGVEIDYDREAAPAARTPGIRIPGMGTDPNDPFVRYDIGPFTGLVVGPNHILISDRCLGEFNTNGASDAVQAITVTLPNGDRWPARVKGRHQQIDLALLELDCIVDKTCPTLKIARLPEGTQKLERGQHIFVVGRGQNPLGVLVNDGIVSALAREDGRAFQLDARIGNSTLGAPVIDKDGTLIGMVTLHNHETFGQASGVSYAAYIHEVRDAYALMAEGKFIPVPPRPFMGVQTAKKWTDKPGLEVGNVVSGSGAERAGLRVGDIILEVDGQPMNEVEDLQGLILKKKVGDTLKVKILRGEEESELRITLGKRP